MILLLLFFKLYGDHRDLHVLTHSFPTRRSADLKALDRLAVAPAGAEIGVEAGGDQSHRAAAVAGHRHLAAVERHQPLVGQRSEEHTSELQSLMRISYAVFCLKKKNNQTYYNQITLYIPNKQQTHTVNNNI